MLSDYFNITVIAEWCCFIVALILLDKKTGLWRLFILWLFLILCTETTGWYLRSQLHQYRNALPFNLLMLVSNVFLIWFFSKSKYLQRVSKLLLYFDCFFILFGLVNLFFFQGPWTYNSYSETLADIALAAICCYFFYLVLTAKEYVNLIRLDYFWLAVGVLFSALGSALLYQFSDALWEYYLQSKIAIGTYINYGINLILYSSLIIAFINRWKTTR